MHYTEIYSLHILFIKRPSRLFANTIAQHTNSDNLYMPATDIDYVSKVLNCIVGCMVIVTVAHSMHSLAPRTLHFL